MKNIIQSLLFLALLLITGVANVAIAAEGYHKIRPPQATQTGDKIEILEIFWYGCPHCYEFEPHIKEWLQHKPEDVTFRRMPGIFSKHWIPHAKAFFTAEKLGVLDKIHTPLFKAIHKQKKKTDSVSAIRKLFVKHGVNKSEFNKVYQSDEVDAKVKKAFLMGQRYKITGVPAIIVNGKYRTSGSTAGSFENVLKVTDMLIKKERAKAAQN